MSVSVTPIKPDIGVEITGISGPAIVDQAVADQAQALLDMHGVVVYREANIDDDDLVAFSRLFGEVHTFPSAEDAQHPELSIVSLDPEVSRVAAVQRGTFLWHIDGTMDEYPHRVTLLTCVEPASDGSGDTEFANTYAAYDALPDEDKAALDGLEVHYSYLNRAWRARRNMSPEAVERYQKLPPRDRPLVWAHHTGRRSMLLGSTAGEVLGWPLEEGEAFLERLLEWSTLPRFTMRHHWERGDLVLWDNTGILHRALPYEPESGRLMHRTTIEGVETVL
jgi:alpha-ketoglutarate-dependent taurine dioxygenase